MRLHVFRKYICDLDSELGSGSPFGHEHGPLNKLLRDAIDAKLIVPKNSGDTIFIVILTKE